MNSGFGRPLLELDTTHAALCGRSMNRGISQVADDRPSDPQTCSEIARLDPKRTRHPGTTVRKLPDFHTGNQLDQLPAGLSYLERPESARQVVPDPQGKGLKIRS